MHDAAVYQHVTDIRYAAAAPCAGCAGAMASQQQQQPDAGTAATFYQKYKTAKTIAKTYQHMLGQKDDQMKQMNRCAGAACVGVWAS